MDLSHLELTHRESIIVDLAPDELYAILSDVTRTGEWSPTCTACWWDDDVDPSGGPGGGPAVGAWFSGRNQVPGRTWETRSRVVAAVPGREFAWQVGGNLVRWGYLLAPADAGGTELTETWEFLDDGLAMFAERYADEALAQVEDRTAQAHAGIPDTLAAIKAVAEAS